jgi:hypothetical protein
MARITARLLVSYVNLLWNAARQEILDLAARLSEGAIISISVRRIETQPRSKEGMSL